MDVCKRSSLKLLSLLGVMLLLLTFATPILSQQALRPNSGQGIEQLLKSGEISQSAGRLEDALRDYSKALTQSTRDPRLASASNVRIGSVYLAQHRLDLALQSFERAISLNSGNAEAHNYLGETFGEMKQYARAIDSFNRAISFDPSLLRARYNMGVTYARMGNTKYSEFVFRSLTKSAPDYALGFDGLAVTLSRSGRANEAISMHEKAIALSPQEPSFYYNLGLSFLILGNTEKALALQEKLRTMDQQVADRLASAIVKRRI